MFRFVVLPCFDYLDLKLHVSMEGERVKERGKEGFSEKRRQMEGREGKLMRQTVEEEGGGWRGERGERRKGGGGGGMEGREEREGEKE